MDSLRAAIRDEATDTAHLLEEQKVAIQDAVDVLNEVRGSMSQDITCMPAKPSLNPGSQRCYFRSSLHRIVQGTGEGNNLCCRFDCALTPERLV